MNTYAKYNQSGEDYLESILTLGAEQSVVIGSTWQSA